MVFGLVNLAKYMNFGNVSTYSVDHVDFTHKLCCNTTIFDVFDCQKSF